MIIVEDGANYTDWKIDEGRIYRDGEDTLIVGTDGKDTLSNDKAHRGIDALAGNDVVENTGEQVTISGGAGNDTIKTSGNETTINGGAGADKISLDSAAENVILEYSDGDGKDSVYGFDKNDSIQVSGSITNSIQSGNNMVFQIGGPNNSITIIDGASYGEEWAINEDIIHIAERPLITLSARADNYSNDINRADILDLGGNDNITNTGNEVSIVAAAGKDTITNFGDESTIEGGDGDDVIINDAVNVYIDGGAGNEKVTLEGNSHDVTVAGGEGNDTIYSNGAGNLIYYADGDGKDVIYGFDGEDSLQIEGDIKSTNPNSNGHVVINVGSGSITIRDAANSDWKIVDNVFSIGENEAITIEGTAKNDTLTNDSKVALMLGYAGNDSIINSGDEVTIDAGAGNDRISIEGEAKDNIIIGGKGNDTIYSNGEGNVIQYSTGDGKDVIVNFSGSDTVEVNGNFIKSTQSGSDAVYYFGSASNPAVTFKDTNLSDLTLDYDDDNATYEIYLNSSSADILDDENFMSFEAQISDISEITDTNYSLTNLDAEQNYNNLAQDDAVAKALTYDDKK